MRRLGVAGLILVAVLAVLVVGIARSPLVLDWLVSKATATVRTKGLMIHWGGRLTADEVDLSDPRGIYARLQDVSIDWSPLRLIHNDVDVAVLSAGQAELLRLPQTSSSGGSSSSTKIEVHALQFDRLQLALAVAGTEAELKVDGSLTWISAADAAITLNAERIDGGGTYVLSASIAPGSIHGQLAVHEPQGGLVAHAAALPDIGPIDLTASVAGPRGDLAAQLALTAGKLRANAHGQVDLERRTLTANVDAAAPTMTLRPDLSFKSAALTATVRGGFSDPDLTGSLRVDALAASGASVQRIDVDATGNKGQVQVRAQLDSVTVPGREPNLLAAAPVLLTADARLDAPDRPVVFALHHPLIDISGTAQTAGEEQADLRLTVPQIGPLAAAEGLDLQGSTSLHLTGARQSGTAQLALDGTLSLTGGTAPGPALVGTSARIAIAANLAADNLSLTRFSIDGRDVAFAANGTVSPQKVDLGWSAALPRLAAVDPHLAGTLRAHGQFSGSEQDLAVVADLAGDVGTPGQPSGPFTAHIQAEGLRHAPRATITGQGALLGSPLRLAAEGVRQSDGAIHLTIHQAEWKSASITGALALSAGAKVPVGDIDLIIQNLSDFAPLVGRALTGSARLTLHATPTEAMLAAELRDAGVPGTGSIADATVNTTIADLASHPSVDGRMVLTGVSVGGLAGSISVDAKGPADRLEMQLAASLPRLDGAEARLASTATVDVPARTVTLSALSAYWRQQNLRLVAPARFAFAHGVEINDLRLGLGDAMMQVNGRISPTLDLTASARNVPAGLAALVFPSFAASGTLSAEARITGTAAAPEGTIRATGAGLRLDNATARDLPPAQLNATATLQGKSALIDATVTAGSSRVTATGRLPFNTTASLDLRSRGAIDLALANPFLGPQGGGLAGTVALTATITGTATTPGGTVRIQASGVRLLTQMGRGLPPAAATATATLNGTTARIDARLTAGASNLAVNGTVPLQLTGALDLHTSGTIDLAVANPLLGATGQRVAGIVSVALEIWGTAAAPRLAGDVRLSNGDVRDYVQGVHLAAITARLVAAGDILRLDSLAARGGEGTIDGGGTIGVFQPGMPINLKLTVHDATPLSGGVVTATVDAALGINGEIGTRIALDGTVDVRQAIIQVPSKLPTSVATIPVRIVGAPPPPKPKPPPVIAMDLTIRAPEQVFIRGRGLNVELGGTIRIQGTTAHMLPRGGFTLRRGTFNLVGTTLTFTSGDISFNGGSLTDPALHLVATSAVGNTSATLTVSGTASNPKITLSSVPEMPQDQILAQLLFPNSNGQLSPFQVASIAAGLAELSGTTSDFPNPLKGVQNALGLDALGIGTGPNGSPSLQAGRYIGRRLYIGAQQSATGAGGQGTIQYDITKGLKLNATVGTGETTSAIGATGESSGASVGVTYQFEY